MAYKIAHEENVHVGILSSTIQKWSNSHPDIFIISKEGHKIYTQSMILRFYSAWLPDVLDGSKDEVGISVSATSNAIGSFMKVLTSGTAFTKVKTELLEIADIAESLGINFQNWQIGEKKNKDFHKDTPSHIVSKRDKVSIDLKLGSLSSGSKMFDCDICGYKNPKKEKIKRHTQIHSNMDRKLKCGPCKVSFKNKVQLEYHQRKIHTEEKEPDEEVADEHMKHDADDAEESDFGSNKFSCTLNELDDTSENDKEAEMKPSVFEKTSDEEETEDSEDQMEGELATFNDSNYTKNDSQEFVCNSCNKVFQKRQKMRRHWHDVHSGIKFSCDQCDYTTSRKENLNTHVKKKHSQF